MLFDQNKFIETIIQWSNLNTGTFNISGLEKMSALLAREFSVLNSKHEVLSLPPIEQIDDHGNLKKVNLGPLLRFWKKPNAPMQVLLVGHMDTVYHQHHAFQTVIRKSNNIIQGPGVADMKGGLCIMLEALKALEQTKEAENLGWEVIINPDEEIGSLGSAPFLMQRARHHRVGLVFEPAMDEKGTFAGARKGSGKFTIVVRGRAAHVGRHFEHGRNAIVKLAHIMQDIHELNGKREGITINIGIIHGGNAVNVVPSLALCHLDIRIRNQDDETWVLKHLEKIFSDSNEAEYKIELQGGFYRKPKPMIGKTKELFELTVNIAHEIGQNLTWKESGGCSDGNTLFEAGLPNIDTLGVSGGHLHSEQEYCLIDSIIPRIELTVALLKKLSQKTGI